MGGRKKTEVGSPKPERPEDELKAEIPKHKARKKVVVESAEPGDKNNSDPDTYRDDIPNSEIKELLTANLRLPTEKMEVHHHPEVEKKGIKEYLLEGLMIFIAVMMGFFAESLREHLTENERAKEYAVTLYSDLKLDTAELKGEKAYFNKANSNVDSLMHLLAGADPKQVPSGKLYWFGLWGGAYRLFLPHDATLLEMKSSGSLRFFGDKIINRRLAEYDQLCQSSKLQESNDQGIYTEVRKARARLFEFQYNDVVNNISHILNTRIRQQKIDSFKKIKPPLLSYDKVLINEYVEMVRSRFFDRKVAAADTLLRHSTELIGLLNKKYKLGDE